MSPSAYKNNRSVDSPYASNSSNPVTLFGDEPYEAGVYRTLYLDLSSLSINRPRSHTVVCLSRVPETAMNLMRWRGGSVVGWFPPLDREYPDGFPIR